MSDNRKCASDNTCLRSLTFDAKKKINKEIVTVDVWHVSQTPAPRVQIVVVGSGRKKKKTKKEPTK